MIGQQIKYNKIDPDSRSRELKKAMTALELAAIVQRVHCVTSPGFPLNATVNEKKFKLNFVDVGLVRRFNQLSSSLILNEDIMLLNQGALVEQFVGQELLAYSPNFEKSKLYFWARDRTGAAEVDYLTVIDNVIYPIEVKAGSAGKMRSLKQYLLAYPKNYGIRLSTLELKREGNILTVPLYLISELPRLIRTLVTT